MITSWLHSYDLLIVATLAAIYISTAVAIHWLCFRPATRALVLSFDGVVTPFIGFSTAIFALTAAFLGASVWQNFQANADAIKNESKTIVEFITVTNAMPGLDHEALVSAALVYVRSAAEQEWPRLKTTKKTDPQTEAAFSALLTTISLAAANDGTPPYVSSALAGWMATLAHARVARLSLLSNTADSARWLCVALLAVLAQISIAAVHLQKKRAMALALGVATISIVVMLGLIALSIETHTGMISVSNQPMDQILQQFSANLR